MSQKQIVPENQFLRQFVIREHNFQTNSNIDWQDTVIYSIPQIERRRHCYEINSIVLGETLRLHLLLDIGNTDSLMVGRLEVRPIFKDGVLGDEVFVYAGTIDTAHTGYDGYRLLWIGETFSGFKVLMETDHEPFRLVDGALIALV